MCEVNQTSVGGLQQLGADVEHRVGRRTARSAGSRRTAAGPGRASARSACGPPPGRSSGRGQQVGPQDPVAQHQAGGDPQPAALGAGEQDVHGGGEVRAEDQRRRGARSSARRSRNSPATTSGVRVLGERALLGQRALLQPVQQRHAQPADAPGSAGSARGCRRSRAAAGRRAGRRPSSVGCSARSSAKGPRATMTPSRTSDRRRLDSAASASAGSPANGSPGVSSTVAR